MKNIEHEDLSWEEIAICNDYADVVINYCRENDIDLSSPSEAECGILECNSEELDFKEWCSLDLEYFLGDIIIAIGMRE